MVPTQGGSEKTPEVRPTPIEIEVRREAMGVICGALSTSDDCSLDALADDNRRRNASWCSGCHRSSGRRSFFRPTLASFRNSCARQDWEAERPDVFSYGESYQLKYAKVQLLDSFASALKTKIEDGRYDNPIPVLRLPMGLRFRRSSVLAWLKSQETTNAA